MFEELANLNEPLKSVPVHSHYTDRQHQIDDNLEAILADEMTYEIADNTLMLDGKIEKETTLDRILNQIQNQSIYQNKFPKPEK